MRSKPHLLWLQLFSFCTEIKGFGPRNMTKPNLSNIKSFKTLHVLLQRDHDDQSIQFYDHNQYSRVNHLSQSWPWHGTGFLLICPSTFIQTSWYILYFNQRNRCQLLKWHTYFGKNGMGSWLTYCEREGLPPFWCDQMGDITIICPHFIRHWGEEAMCIFCFRLPYARNYPNVELLGKIGLVQCQMS